MTFIKLLLCHDCLVKFGCHFGISLGLGLASLWAFAEGSVCVQWLYAGPRALCCEMCGHCRLLSMCCDSEVENSPFLPFVPPESLCEARSLYFFPGVLADQHWEKKNSLAIVFQPSNQEVKRKGEFKWCQVLMPVWFSSQRSHYFHNPASI